MIYSTPAGVEVRVLKKYAKRRIFSPANQVRTILCDSLDCIQSLASGKVVCCEGYDQHRDSIAGWLKEEFPHSFKPNFVVAPPSRRLVAGDLARSFAHLYACIDLSSSFTKLNPAIRAGEQGVDATSLTANLTYHGDLKSVRDGDSILIVDDIYSTGNSIDAIREKISLVSRAQNLHFMGAAILGVYVEPAPTPHPSPPSR